MKLSEVSNSFGNNNKISLLDSIGLKTDMSQNKENSQSFSNVLKNSIEEVNQTQVKAYDAMSDIATGKVENLQEAVQKIEEAELSLKLGLEVKNKALSAFKQVMAMQV
ncbi:flagellar hook-basal body complex protein FliE [Arcobacteraceae bacterium]|nr:flagellar hook-basal body complex protein FliE [Arcobacteraceae bacterium]